MKNEKESYKGRLDRFWAGEEMQLAYYGNRATYDLVCDCLNIHILANADDNLLKAILIFGYSLRTAVRKAERAKL